MKEKKERVVELGYLNVFWYRDYSAVDFRRWCERGRLGSLYRGSVIVKVHAGAPCGSDKSAVIDSLISELQKYKEGLKDE